MRVAPKNAAQNIQLQHNIKQLQCNNGLQYHSMVRVSQDMLKYCCIERGDQVRLLMYKVRFFRSSQLNSTLFDLEHKTRNLFISILQQKQVLSHNGQFQNERLAGPTISKYQHLFTNKRISVVICGRPRIPRGDSVATSTPGAISQKSFESAAENRFEALQHAVQSDNRYLVRIVFIGHLAHPKVRMKPMK